MGGDEVRHRPMHGPVYEFFKDQGSLVAGVLALIAAVIGGGFVYWAGKLQVREMQRQITHMQAAALEHDRRARSDLLNMLDAQAAEMARLAAMKQSVAKLLHSPPFATSSSALATVFTMVGPDIEAHGFATLVPGEIRLAARELWASVNELNSLIHVFGPRNALLWQELIEALQKVQDRAANLQSALREYLVGGV
jgi:hypothetical protein